jgi:hypothetical protein
MTDEQILAMKVTKIRLQEEVSELHEFAESSEQMEAIPALGELAGKIIDVKCEEMVDHYKLQILSLKIHKLRRGIQETYKETR